MEWVAYNFSGCSNYFFFLFLTL